MLDLYSRDPDPGIHAALEWVLRKWGKGDELKALDRQLAAGKPEEKRRWYVTRQGHTFARLDGGLAIATKEVTVEQFLQFRKEHHYNPQYAPNTDCPVNWVTWYDAVAYCNWLSEQEGIDKAEWCYEQNADGRFAAGVKVKANYRRLSGYRLPSEEEWEFACRAGAVTSRYYGEAEALLGKYAAYTQGPNDRCMRAVGSVKPNDWGLFDMLGNAQEWCHGRDVPRPAQAAKGPETTAARPDGDEPEEEIADPVDRVIRGGSFLPGPAVLTATYRDEGRPSDRGGDVGFRPARTWTKAITSNKTP
jgi:formylglycine-generating enzyme required for sulfatase activity